VFFVLGKVILRAHKVRINSGCRYVNEKQNAREKGQRVPSVSKQVLSERRQERRPGANSKEKISHKKTRGSLL
jgi:hypothetical protein